MLGALVLALAACGGKDKSASSVDEQPAKAEVVIKASNWKFDQAEYIVPKDTPVKIILENTEGAHGIKVTGTDINLGPGKQSTVVTLKAGTYDFRCSIMCGSGHAGMVSKLIVQ
ncbi:cytochrome C oxidase subunit II [Cohnella pontilimi]|uniref:Cytochrome C oxidase subunit II n=2 Tax=Cohnella pontilimi TaxID=2564100 RepID=A0A4U0F9I8_9BACL|nr:cytochrome C oxidase subunit II [Cohnella pontilimi]